MKNILIIVTSLAIGILAGSALGFWVPFGIAQLRPDLGPGLSFAPILAVPAGAALGGVLGIVYGVTKIKRENLIREIMAQGELRGPR